MKKIYATICAMAATALAFAENPAVPNGGFEEGWADCTPWTSSNNTKTKGETPAPWCISHVIGMGGTGATEVASKVEGYESASAVELKNTANPILSSQKVPSYITLGTTWSTAISKGLSVSNSDGGTFGGVEFAGRPTGMEFMYKRSRGTAKPDEQSTVVAYLWKGHWTQASVPGDIKLFSTPTKVDMVDRDRCVLGMETSEGGAVTKTDDAELIAKINATITENSDDWVKFHADFEYLSDATPEYMNIIIAAGDYFGGAEVVGEGNSLTVDDVKFIYAAEEPAEDPFKDADVYDGSLTIEMNGGQITDEPVAANVEILYADADKCTLRLPNFKLALDADSEPVPLGDIVVPNVTVSVDGSVATYTGSVKNLELAGGEIVADADVYGTIDYKGNASFKINVIWMGIPIDVTFNGTGKQAPGTVAPAVDADVYAGSLTINLNGSDITDEPVAANVEIVYDSEDKCTLSLPDFKLALDADSEPVPLGDIVVPNVAVSVDGSVATYTGSVKGLELAGGEIVADADVEGTINYEGKASFKINVTWMGLPILVTFNGEGKQAPGTVAGIQGVEADENAPAEYYDLRGIRHNADALAPGIYIKRQGGKATKVLVK